MKDFQDCIKYASFFEVNGMRENIHYNFKPFEIKEISILILDCVTIFIEITKRNEHCSNVYICIYILEDSYSVHSQFSKANFAQFLYRKIKLVIYYAITYITFRSDIDLKPFRNFLVIFALIFFFISLSCCLYIWCLWLVMVVGDNGKQ